MLGLMEVTVALVFPSTARSDADKMRLVSVPVDRYEAAT